MMDAYGVGTGDGDVDGDGGSTEPQDNGSHGNAIRTDRLDRETGRWTGTNSANAHTTKHLPPTLRARYRT